MAADIGALERAELALGDRPSLMRSRNGRRMTKQIPVTKSPPKFLNFVQLEEVVINLGERERGTRLPPPHTVQRRPGACE